MGLEARIGGMGGGVGGRRIPFTVGYPRGDWRYSRRRGLDLFTTVAHAFYLWPSGWPVIYTERVHIIMIMTIMMEEIAFQF
jgi:hypothetical protein